MLGCGRLCAGTYTVLDNLVARDDLCGLSEHGGDAAVFRFRKLDGLSHGPFRDIVPAHDVADFHACVTAWMLRAARPSDLDAILRDLLPLLLQDGNDIDGRATSQCDEQQFYRGRRTTAFVVCIEHLRVPARTDADEQIFSGKVNRCFRVFLSHFIDPQKVKARDRLKFGH